MKYRDVTIIHERFHCMGGMMASLRGHRSSSGMQNDNNLILPTERLPVLWPLFPVSWLLTSSILKHWASFWLGGELSAYLPIFQNQDDVHFQSNRCGQPLIRPSGAVLNTAMAAGRGKRVSKGKEICRISPFSALCFLFSSSSSTFSSKFPHFSL